MRKLRLWGGGGGGVEVGDVTAFMVKVEASDGVMNCRRETGN